MALTTTSSPLSPVSPAPLDELLIVDASDDAAACATILRSSYRVATTASADIAKQFLRRHPPALVVADLDVPGSGGIEVCREAKTLSATLPVLVTTAQTERVPEALVVGCDAVLLKPFAPNLLFARIGRLLRARSEMLRAKVRHQQLKTAHLTDRSEGLLAGTNRVWPNTHCPYCDNGGATSFEFCSHRRAWYAC